MAMEYSKRYRFKKIDTPQIPSEDEATIYDERFNIDIRTVPYLNRFRLSNKALLALVVQLAYNPSRGVFEIPEAQTIVSRINAYYYGATLPSITEPGYEPVALDDHHRLFVNAYIPELGKLELIGSTTTPLAASGEWISPVDSLMETGRIVGSVYADVDGTLYVEQSPDNTNWDIVDSFSITGGSGIGFSVEKVAQYARVRYVNGAADQTVFRLYAYRRLRIL